MSEKYVMVVPFENRTEAIFAGVRDFPTERLILLAPAHKHDKAEAVARELGVFQIPVEVMSLEDETSFEDVFSKIGYIKAREKGKNILINLGASGEMLTCIALSSGFVNGLQTFTVRDKQTFFFPVLKFSYHDMLSDNKLKILDLLFTKKCCSSLEDLARKANIGPSLINYHIYGNEKNPGLKELGLIDLKRVKGRVTIDLTTLGNLLMQKRDLEEEQKEEASKETAKEPEAVAAK